MMPVYKLLYFIMYKRRDVIGQIKTSPIRPALYSFGSGYDSFPLMWPNEVWELQSIFKHHTGDK
jgi:hypothetical protein